MDISELTTRLGALPGQLPDLEACEPRYTRLVRATVFDNPQMFELYRAQGLPVEVLTAAEAFVVEPDGDDPGPPVLFEAGVRVVAGRLETVVTGSLVRVELSAPEGEVAPGAFLIELVRLRSSGVLSLRYTLPAPAGRVIFLVSPEIFGLRATLLSQEGRHLRPLAFGPRIMLPRA